MEGYLIGRRELFCPELRHNRVNIGLWEKHLSKFENLPLGCKFRFDAYFNDILQIYIVNFLNILKNQIITLKLNRHIIMKILLLMKFVGWIWMKMNQKRLQFF